MEQSETESQSIPPPPPGHVRISGALVDGALMATLFDHPQTKSNLLANDFSDAILQKLQDTYGLDGDDDLDDLFAAHRVFQSIVSPLANPRLEAHKPEKDYLIVFGMNATLPPLAALHRSHKENIADLTGQLLVLESERDATKKATPQTPGASTSASARATAASTSPSQNDRIMAILSRLEADVVSLKDGNKQLKDDNQQLKDDNKQVKNDNKQLKDDNKQLKNDNKQMKDDMKQLQETVSKQGVVLMKQGAALHDLRLRVFLDRARQSLVNIYGISMKTFSQKTLDTFVADIARKLSPEHARLLSTVELKMIFSQAQTSVRNRGNVAAHTSSYDDIGSEILAEDGSARAPLINIYTFATGEQPSLTLE